MLPSCGGLAGRLALVALLTNTAVPALAIVAPRVAIAAPSRSQQNQKELKARKAFASGRFQEALDIFAELYAETLHPVYLRNIGRCHQKLREPGKAVESFRDYLAKGKDISASERAEVEGFIREMQALEEEQRRAAAPPPAPTPPPPAPSPQPPKLSAEPPGAVAVVPASITEAPADESPSFYTRPWFWITVGVVAAGAVAAAVLLSSGSTAKDPACPADVDCGGK